MSAKKLKGTKTYHRFRELDGHHPWMDQVPEGFVPYPVRETGQGHVVYFNFDLAKEMGLISKSHPKKLNKDLEREILRSFSIQIINEYDQESGRRFKKVKDKPFMATRYLQLQHSSKVGKTSGDGRGIWNGVIKNNGVTWDVSSRGTGVTRLAPGAVEAQKNLRTGSEAYGYGCGLAEIDELVACAMMSEVFHRQGIKTERVLAIISNDGKTGIGVRASENLLRPAHVFLFLKQDQLEPLTRGIDYLIERQKFEWKFNQKNKYDQLLEHLAKEYARFSARLEREFIFAWLDWDGDNFLASGGIIDYGSIRQLGVRHDQYRYDDVMRYSTNLNEQWRKARYMYQTFVQAVDFIKTGKRKKITKFANSKWIKLFNQEFENERYRLALKKCGFNDASTSWLMKTSKRTVKKLFHYLELLEKAKVSGKSRRVADGINHPPRHDVRKLLLELPQRWKDLNHLEFYSDYLDGKDLKNTILSDTISRKDRKLPTRQRINAMEFQRVYKQLVTKLIKKNGRNKVWDEIISGVEYENRLDRMTGNAVDLCVHEVLGAYRKKSISSADMQRLIDYFIGFQAPTEDPALVFMDGKVGELIDSFHSIVEQCREDL